MQRFEFLKNKKKTLIKADQTAVLSHEKLFYRRFWDDDLDGNCVGRLFVSQMSQHRSLRGFLGVGCYQSADA